ncbi:hypothetical protein UlMin_039606 [Ulmus minor]
MTRGGASRGGNNGGNRVNTGKSSGVNTKNQFAIFDSSDHSFVNDSHSLFFLTSGNHPGLSLVSTSLTGSNYNSWSRAMTMALIAKNKMCFVNGSVSKHEIDDQLYNFWSRCNNMVMSWILNAESKEIADSVMYINTAVEMWNDLHDRFSQGNGPRIFQLKQEIHAFTQGSLDVSGYFTKLKIFWDELRDFKPLPACTCGAMKDLLDCHNQDYIF